MIVVNLISSEKLILQIAKNGMTRKQFAEKAGISSGYVTQIVKGMKNPSPKVAYKIAETLDLKVEDLFEYEYLEDTVQ